VKQIKIFFTHRFYTTLGDCKRKFRQNTVTIVPWRVTQALLSMSVSSRIGLISSLSAYIILIALVDIQGGPIKSVTTSELSLNRIENPPIRLNFSSNLSVKAASEYHQLLLNILCV